MGPSIYAIIALGGPILLAKSLWYKVCLHSIYITTEFGFPSRSKALAHHDMHEINFVVWNISM
jgi:hypothetical protein